MPNFKKRGRSSFLDAILGQPASPFREKHVVHTVCEQLRAARVKHFLDPVGNVVVGAENRTEYLAKLSVRTAEPLRLFVAHMDHPGFHGVKWNSPTRLAVKWFGGSATHDIVGAKVWLADDTGWLEGDFRFSKVKMNSRRTAIESGEIELRRSKGRLPPSDPTRIFGGMGFRAPWWQEGRIIYTKAADDLVGVAVICELARTLSRKAAANRNFLGLLTRGEEVGFIGAIGHFELGWHKKSRREVVVVSLETSKTLPKALIGKGPVVRVGDRAGPFDPAATHLLKKVAQEALPDRFQHCHMDGGTCEATAALAYGLRAVGISVPLGNYHNQNFQGGPDSRAKNGPAPEFVHLDDVEGMLKLCQALSAPGADWSTPWEDYRKKLSKQYKNAKALLSAGRIQD